MGHGYWAVQEKRTGRYVGDVGFANYRRDAARALRGAGNSAGFWHPGRMAMVLPPRPSLQRYLGVTRIRSLPRPGASLSPNMTDLFAWPSGADTSGSGQRYLQGQAHGDLCAYQGLADGRLRLQVLTDWVGSAKSLVFRGESRQGAEIPLARIDAQGSAADPKHLIRLIPAEGRGLATSFSIWQCATVWWLSPCT